MHSYPSEQPHQEESNSDESKELNSWGLTARQTDQLMDVAMRFRRQEVGGPVDGDQHTSREEFLRRADQVWHDELADDMSE